MTVSTGIAPDLYKLHRIVGEESSPYTHPAVHRLTPGQRIVAGVPGGDVEIFIALIDRLAGPFHLLYILHTTRGEAELGRYQSTRIDKAEVLRWLRRFADYLRADGRFDLWAHSPEENATLVWDRHDRLFAYGPLEDFDSALRERGSVEGDASIPSPHEHHYRSVCDGEARALLASRDWSWSPLQPEDEQ
jgi:hypothetical protein